ncbi:MAG: aminotransferase class IV, partial [Candidatus Omnitrophica bacterium]|nr:aminotransferase class IV [Candidatus Omnitrophota bacterium]
MKTTIFLDGKFLSLELASISLIEPAFLYGWGLFETMRAYKNRIVYLKAHLKRIKDSAKYLDLKLPYSLNKTEELIFKTVKLNKLKDAYVRLTLFKNLKNRTSIFILAKRYQPYPKNKYLKGFKACLILDLKVNEGCFLTNLKTANYLLYRLAYWKAKKKGYDEALLLNNRGYLAEGSFTNIFFIKRRRLFTPHLKSGCLKGITRQVVIDLAKKNRIDSIEEYFTLQDLFEADEVFLTN